MSFYRTEIEIAPDRFVCLQLPLDLPEGRATITIEFPDSGVAENQQSEPEEPDRVDIEWWEEFDQPEFSPD